MIFVMKENYFRLKNTKNWYAIDALGAILPILTVLILGISQNVSKTQNYFLNQNEAWR